MNVPLTFASVGTMYFLILGLWENCGRAGIHYDDFQEQK
jgi:hypothetical protein